MFHVPHSSCGPMKLLHSYENRYHTTVTACDNKTGVLRSNHGSVRSYFCCTLPPPPQSCNASAQLCHIRLFFSRVKILLLSLVSFQEPAAESSESGAGAFSAATTLSGMIDEDRIAEMQLKRRRVRRMCARQRAATSQWWRDALQRYAQRRMWMHLGPPKQGQLPERFVRIHEVLTI